MIVAVVVVVVVIVVVENTCIHLIPSHPSLLPHSLSLRLFLCPSVLPALPCLLFFLLPFPDSTPYKPCLIILLHIPIILFAFPRLLHRPLTSPILHHCTLSSLLFPSLPPPMSALFLDLTFLYSAA
ncbi:hypothetical protein F5H01DRAFT_208564 [Linnemannia elongata]|nr:hypothetical protein F5H01DRAFT_208564 [Linnemannia elongata]